MKTDRPKPKKGTEKQAPDPAAAGDHVIRKIAASGSGGVSPGKLGASAGSPIAAAVRQLEKQKAIANIGSKKRPRYVLMEFAPNLETVGEKIAVMAEGKPDNLFSKNAFLNAFGSLEKKFVPEALTWLAEDRRIRKLLYGRRALYLYAGRALPEENPDASDTGAANIAEDEEKIIRSYSGIVDPAKGPYITVESLFRETGLSWDRFVSAVLSMSERGIAVPGRGDLSFTSNREREFTLTIGNEPYFLIRIRQ